MRRVFIPDIWDFLLIIPVIWVYGGLLVSRGVDIIWAIVTTASFSLVGMTLSKFISSIPFLKIKNVFYASLATIPCAFLGSMIFGVLLSSLYGADIFIPIDFYEIVLFLTLIARSVLLWKEIRKSTS